MASIDANKQACAEQLSHFSFIELLTSLPDDHSEREPPDPIPNSEVKPLCADDSVGFPHVKVGHRQALNQEAPLESLQRGFLFVR